MCADVLGFDFVSECVPGKIYELFMPIYIDVVIDCDITFFSNVYIP